MLPKNERLKDRYLFNLVFKKKIKLYSRFLTLYYLRGKKDINMFPKSAFAVGLNIDKRATRRNLIKRRIREAYKIVKKKLPKISVLVWVANPPIKDATFIQVKDSVQNLLCKLEQESNTFEAMRKS